MLHRKDSTIYPCISSLQLPFQSSPNQYKTLQFLICLRSDFHWTLQVNISLESNKMSSSLFHQPLHSRMTSLIIKQSIKFGNHMQARTIRISMSNLQGCAEDEGGSEILDRRCLLHMAMFTITCNIGSNNFDLVREDFLWIYSRNISHLRFSKFILRKVFLLPCALEYQISNSSLLPIFGFWILWQIAPTLVSTPTLVIVFKGFMGEI